MAIFLTLTQAFIESFIHFPAIISIKGLDYLSQSLLKNNLFRICMIHFITISFFPSGWRRTEAILQFLLEKWNFYYWQILKKKSKFAVGQIWANNFDFFLSSTFQCIEPWWNFSDSWRFPKYRSRFVLSKVKSYV